MEARKSSGKTRRTTSRKAPEGEGEVIERAREMLREGRPATEAAGEFIVEENRRAARGESPAKFPKQAVAIGLSKA